METKKVILRPVERHDLAFLRDLANETEVRENVVGWDWPVSLSGQERWFDSGIDTSTTRRFIVENVETSQPIGLTGLWKIDWRNRSAETGLKLGGFPDVRGKGFGVAAIGALMEFAFKDVGLHRLHSTILTSNKASQALFVRKCGWTEEGILRKHVWRKGEFCDLLQIGILENEYDLWRQKNSGF